MFFEKKCFHFCLRLTEPTARQQQNQSPDRDRILSSSACTAIRSRNSWSVRPAAKGSWMAVASKFELLITTAQRFWASEGSTGNYCRSLTTEGWNPLSYIPHGSVSHFPMERRSCYASPMRHEDTLTAFLPHLHHRKWLLDDCAWWYGATLYSGHHCIQSAMGQLIEPLIPHWSWLQVCEYVPQPLTTWTITFRKTCQSLCYLT